MKKRNRKRSVVTEVPDNLDESSPSVASRLIETHGFDEGIQKFWVHCAERKAWQDSNGVALDPSDYHIIGLPTGVTGWRFGAGDVRPRSEF